MVSRSLLRTGENLDHLDPSFFSAAVPMVWAGTDQSGASGAMAASRLYRPASQHAATDFKQI